MIIVISKKDFEKNAKKLVEKKEYLICDGTDGVQSRGSVKGACSSPSVYVIGSYAMGICESCQVGNEAALSRNFHVL